MGVLCPRVEDLVATAAEAQGVWPPGGWTACASLLSRPAARGALAPSAGGRRR
jgi:hypothetical protein